MFMITVAAALAAALPATAPPTANDIAALEALKESNDLAWNRKDAATIASQYVDNATIRVAPGQPLVSGQDAIGAFFTAAFARRQGEFRHVTKLDHFDVLPDGSVLSEGDVRVEKRERTGAWSLARRFRTLSIAVRSGSGWKLRSVRAIPLDS